MNGARFFLRLSAQEAERGARKKHGGPFGAVVVRKGRVVAKAHNEVLRSGDPTCHAEMLAIRRACRRLRTPFLSDCEIFSSTEPCAMCFSGIHWARLKQVSYGTTIQDVFRLGFNELLISAKQLKKIASSPVRVTRVINSDCRTVLRKWSQMPNKETY